MPGRFALAVDGLADVAVILVLQGQQLVLGLEPDGRILVGGTALGVP